MIDESEDTKVEVKKEEPNPALEAAKAATEAAKQASEQVQFLKGQLSVLTAAAAGDQTPPAAEEAPDLLSDTEKSLDYHVRKRTQGLVVEQLSREARREAEMLALKQPDDWKEYGAGVKEMIQANKISDEVLAQPGAYEQLLNMVKAKNIDQIVEKKIAQQKAAAALSSPSGTKGAITDEAKAAKMSDAERRVAMKMGVSEDDWMAQTKNVHVEGPWIIGEVD